MDRFRAVQAFARVVEFGSFARAAERLGTSTSAVSRLVADLEAHLDARLIHRTTRRLSLTEVGQSFYERSVQLLADLDEAESSVRAVAVVPRGVLRLTCGVSFGERFLAPAISEFSARHRDIVWDLDLSDRAIDLVEEGFDLAIRIGTVVHQGLVSRRLGWTTPVCCASPAHLARHGTPRTPADLASHEVLSYTLVPLPQVWRFESAQGERHELRVTTRHRANNGRMLASLASAGLGVAIEPDFIVAPEVRSGALVRLLPDYTLPRSPISAVYPSRRHLSAKVRTFVEFLAQRFEREQPWRLDEAKRST
ncbi:MAG: HTH-type transcriptional regulator DmlR [Steroidobacteraceae bacterium]|nr:HTH-type transcriptional regulator DmlR [Steroidobacteraceae bacterium]